MAMKKRGKSVNRNSWKMRVIKGWNRSKTRPVVMGLCLLSLLSLNPAVHAQEYPAQAINMMIDRPPGAGTDVVARVLAPGASRVLGQEVIPINKPGAGGAVAVGILASSRPDGYTLLAHTMSSLRIPSANPLNCREEASGSFCPARFP
jgi:tripartite-type tricarboxylate transporter receptor subunit TctC